MERNQLIDHQYSLWLCQAHVLNKHHNMDVVVFFHKANKVERHLFQYFSTPRLATEFCSIIDTELVYKKTPSSRLVDKWPICAFKNLCLVQ